MRRFFWKRKPPSKRRFSRAYYKMRFEDGQRSTELYLRLMPIVGTAVFLFSAYRLPVARLDLRFLLLLLITIACSRATIEIPRFKSHFSFTDTFIFLTMLLFGGEAAILLAGTEGFCSSLRFCKRKLSVLFNAALMTVSTFITMWALRYSFGDIEILTRGDNYATLILALCLMALVQYATNSSLAAIYGAFKSGQNYWQTWSRSYLWTSITYFAGALAAGVIAVLTNRVGFHAIIIAAPIIAIVYYTYRMYLKNIEISLAQAEQARCHAAALQEQAGALQESEERFRSAFDYASTGMALVSLEGRWFKVNHSLCESIGYSEQELLAMSFQAITHPDDVDAALNFVRTHQREVGHAV